MTGGLAARKGRGGLALIALALLALFVRVVIPAGFMPAAKGLSGGLVICTGHGPLVIGAPEKPTPTKSKTQGVCAFAAAPVPLEPGAASPILASKASFLAPVDDTTPDQTPGLGLPAPPPPSLGPPLSI